MTDDSPSPIVRQRQLIIMLQDELETATKQGNHAVVGQLSSAILQAQLALNAMQHGSPLGAYLTR
ncbi:hypothetical protein [Pantanalinema sp. GBBB05]|uniref:hypothetical protein n=1 Tax=Pantanalinema sp. GBBB05 TaxID=2604139 RepID=UPI001D89702E|nr:hypothetical protein [Pantanalinema sp. GBBB05]